MADKFVNDKARKKEWTVAENVICMVLVDSASVLETQY